MDETYVNDALYQKLKTFQPWNEQEAADQRVMLAYMEQFPDIYNRENVFAHMTSSPWIMNHTKDKVKTMNKAISEKKIQKMCCWCRKVEELFDENVIHLHNLSFFIYNNLTY